MMNKIVEILKKYKTTALSAIIVFVICIVALVLITTFTKTTSLRKIEEKTYALQYDNSWKVVQKVKNKIVLKHPSGSKVTIQITKLSNEHSYDTIDELIEEIIFSVQEQNKDYKLLSKQKAKLTKYEFDGYNLLYENGKEQVLLSLYKKSDKLITVEYKATNDYFDILLDSVHNIIYHLDAKEESFDLSKSLKIETTDLNYLQSEEVDKSLKNSTTYEIASNNYYVKYSLPSSFIRSTLDSSLGLYYLDLKDNRMDITTSILNRNIYEYIEPSDKYSNVYGNYSYYHKEDNKDYSNFKESLSKLPSKYTSYIYKNSYTYNNALGFDKDNNLVKQKRSDEIAELIYFLDNNHILVIKISAQGYPITEKLVNMIQVESFKNYASYIKIEKDKNNLIGKLQKFENYSKRNIMTVTLKVPDKYIELDRKANIYTDRYYALNYNEDMEIYDYNVHYQLTTLSAESILKTIYISSSYGEYHDMTYTNDLTLNNKLFKVYDGGETKRSGIMFTDINRKTYYTNKKVLIHEISKESTLWIEIDGNGKEITSEILNELVNFTVEMKEEG